ncbi:MAG: hypothetical protein OEO84_08675 [Betaproteobacteria bacterium]|nr:hypothetical protein [Betaproteobacteria bacterium]
MPEEERALKACAKSKVHDRLNQNDVTNKINVEDPDRVRDAVLALFAARYPEADLAPLRRAFDDVKSLFQGTYPGYLPCDTPYHDLRHTLDMTLAMARLFDGHDRSHAEAERIGARRAMLGIIVALLHDSGYLKRASEAHVENGAVFTKIHVSRSADFLTRYLPQLGFADEAPAAAKLVHFTGYEMDIDDIMLHDPKDRLLGYLLGTADLIGQMSDRLYLEKCREFLYPEFVWGHIAREKLADGREIVRYASPDDLMLKTPGFYEYVARARIERKLGGVDRYAAAHFDGPSLYQSEIDRNMRFLKNAIDEADLKRMRRFCYSLSRKEAQVA